MVLITNLDTAHASTTPRELDVVADGAHLHATSIGSYLRPANILAYLAGDVVSDSTGTAAAIVFPNCAKVIGGGGSILRAFVGYEEADTVAFDLLVFDVEPTNHVDSAPLACISNDLRNLVAYYEFPDADKKTLGAGIIHYQPTLDQALGLPHAYVCEPASTNLYGLLVARTAFTPLSAAKVHIRLQLEID